MKIITLGTSHGATEPGRACSGTLIEIDGFYYLFDCGGNVEGKMTDLGLPINKIRAVFISHMHEDHVGSLSAISKRFTNYIKTGEKLKIFMPEQNGIEVFKSWLSAMHFSDISKLDFSLVLPGCVYSDENISVSSILTEHLSRWNAPSFAYVIHSCDKKVLYTGDLSCDFHDYPDVVFFEDFDAVVSELVHFSVENNLDTIIKTRTKKMIFTHMAPRNIPVIESSLEKFPFDVQIAVDCKMFEI